MDAQGNAPGDVATELAAALPDAAAGSDDDDDLDGALHEDVIPPAELAGVLKMGEEILAGFGQLDAGRVEDRQARDTVMRGMDLDSEVEHAIARNLAALERGEQLAELPATEVAVSSQGGESALAQLESEADATARRATLDAAVERLRLQAFADTSDDRCAPGLDDALAAGVATAPRSASTRTRLLLETVRKARERAQEREDEAILSELRGAGAAGGGDENGENDADSSSVDNSLGAGKWTAAKMAGMLDGLEGEMTDILQDAENVLASAAEARRRRR